MASSHSANILATLTCERFSLTSAPVIKVDLLPNGQVLHQWTRNQTDSRNIICQEVKEEEDLCLGVSVIEGGAEQVVEEKESPSPHLSPLSAVQRLLAQQTETGYLQETRDDPRFPGTFSTNPKTGQMHERSCDVQGLCDGFLQTQRCGA